MLISLPVCLLLLLGTSHCMRSHDGVDHFGVFEAQFEGGIYEDLPGAFGDGEFIGDPYMHYDYHVLDPHMLQPEGPVTRPYDFTDQRSEVAPPPRSTGINENAGQKSGSIGPETKERYTPQASKSTPSSVQKRQVDLTDPNCNTTTTTTTTSTRIPQEESTKVPRGNPAQESRSNNRPSFKKSEPERNTEYVNTRLGLDRTERRRMPSNLRKSIRNSQVARRPRPPPDDRPTRPSPHSPRNPPSPVSHRHLGVPPKSTTRQPIVRPLSPASVKTSRVLNGKPSVLARPPQTLTRPQPKGSGFVRSRPDDPGPAAPGTFDELPNQYKTGLSNLLQLLSVHESGRQILVKLNILERQLVSNRQQSSERMSLTPRKADRLLRLLSSMKASKSGKGLLYQLDLADFMNLPKLPPRVDASGKRIMNHEVPTSLDFTAYNYNGGGGCVDELMRDTMKKYRQPRRFPDPIDELFSRTPGFLTTEMDMVLTGQQWRDFYGSMPAPRGRRAKRAMDGALARSKRKAIKEARYYWPDKTVPYILDDNEFNWSDIMLFERAMYEWEQSTCVRFKLASPTDVNKIRFRSGMGCSSHVGMIGGTQNITLQGPCRIRRIVLHEIGHSLGLVHEHQRPDRDNYIQILYANARPGTDWDFEKRTWGTVVNHTVGYDYMSVMHYGPKAFSMDQQKPTILTRDSKYQDSIGKVTELSFNDKKLVNMMYKCAAQCPKTVVCQHGGYVNKDCKCACPSTHPNCQVRETKVERPEPAQTDNSWMSLFQAFSWNALNALGLGNSLFPPRVATPRVTPPRAPVIDHMNHLMDMLDSPSRNRQRQLLSPLAQSPLNRLGRHRLQPQVNIQHVFHRRIKRESGATPLTRVKRFIGIRARPRVRSRNSYIRRRPVYRRRKVSRRNKLPRLSRKYFQSISENDKEARRKEIRYNSRRRRYEKENKRSRYYWK